MLNVLVDIIAAFWRMSARNVQQETQQQGMVAPVKTAVTWVGVRLYMCNIFLLLWIIYFTYFASRNWEGWSLRGGAKVNDIYIFSLFIMVAVSLLFTGHQFKCNPLLSPLLFSKVRNETLIIIDKTINSDIFVCCKSYVYVWMSVVFIALSVFFPTCILPLIYRCLAFV